MRGPAFPAKMAVVVALTTGSACHRAEAPAASSLLELVADIELPGNPVRFDYQGFDAVRGNLVIAHMNDDSVVIVRPRDRAVVKNIEGIPTPRGIAVAESVGRVFLTSSPKSLLILDADSFTEVGRVATGNGPDGVAWDPVHGIVGVSDQHDGAASLIAEAGSGARTAVPLGQRTGNIAFDPSRGLFWITVEMPAPPDALVAIDPVSAKEAARIPLPGCATAHGLSIHPDGKSALVVCEDNARLLRVDLNGSEHAITVASTGAEPDVLAIDPALGWLYVAAESGDLTVFDIGRPGLAHLARDAIGEASHSVVVDPRSHEVFFPLQKGPNGRPTLRIMRPRQR